MRSVFGLGPGGDPVERVVLRGGGLTMALLSWGCVVQDLRIEGHAAPLVLGFETFEPYLAHSPYFGATVGRYANRIAHGRFVLDGKAHQLDRNQGGKHHLHGGALSLGRRNWRFDKVAADRATLAIEDADGVMGYPGNCRLTAEFALDDDGMTIRYRGETDMPTLVNLAHHSYFNLSGSGDVLDHELRIAADRYLPVDAQCIPVGNPEPVGGTVFDFRTARPIRREVEGSRAAYDHNFCLSENRTALLEVAELRSPQSGIWLTVSTTETGLQFYDGQKVAVPVPGLGGARYGPCSGLCLEPQVWPDSPNRPDFPSAVLRPGETYEQVTRLRFGLDP